MGPSPDKQTPPLWAIHVGELRRCIEALGETGPTAAQRLIIDQAELGLSELLNRTWRERLQAQLRQLGQVFRPWYQARRRRVRGVCLALAIVFGLGSYVVDETHPALRWVLASAASLAMMLPDALDMALHKHEGD